MSTVISISLIILFIFKACCICQQAGSADTTGLYSFLFLLIKLFSTLCLFLVQTVGYLTRGGLQYLYMFRVYIRIIMESYRDGKGHSSEFFNSQVPRYFLFASPEAHESDVSVVLRTRCSVPPPSRMKRQSTVLNGDGTRVFIGFCTARHPELASAGVSQNPFRGMGPLFCTARTRWS